MNLLLLYSTGIFLFLSLLLYPLGYLLAVGIPLPRRLAVSFGLSAVLYMILILVWRYLELPSSALFLPLYLLLGVSTWFCAKRGGFSQLFSSESLPGFLFMFSYYLLVISLSAFPDGQLESVSGEGIRQITALPIDNIIPFNFSRYLVEGIAFDSMEVVPTWAASSRGPLAGAIVAVVFVMISVSEKLAWLGTSPGVYFFFQCTMVFLNSLVFYAVWLLARSFFSNQIASWSILALATSSFVLSNIIFTWPKFLMTYFVLAILYLVLAQSRARFHGVYLGVLAAGAYLSHQMALFYILPLLLYVLVSRVHALRLALAGALPHSDVQRWYFRENLQELAFLALSIFSSLAPWLLLKAKLPDGGQRMQYLHLFCITDQEVGGLSMLDAARRYFQQHSWFDILKAKLANLWYPFDISHPAVGINEFLLSPYRVLSAIASVSFFQFIFAVGPLLLFLAVCAPRFARDARGRTILRKLLGLSFAALCVAALVYGCAASTLNHVWAYPAITLTLIAAAYCTEAESVIPAIVFVISCAFNAVVLLLNFFYPSTGVLWLHASPQYFIVPSVALLLCVLSFFYMMFFSGKSNETRTP